MKIDYLEQSNITPEQSLNIVSSIFNTFYLLINIKYIIICNIIFSYMV